MYTTKHAFDEAKLDWIIWIMLLCVAVTDMCDNRMVIK